MEQAPLKPGQIRLQRRVSTRRKFDDMIKAPILSVDDALSFIDVIEKQMPAVKKALQKVRINSVFDSSRVAAQEKPVMQAPIHETYTDNDAQTPDIQVASKMQGATEEQKRIEQLKKVKEATEKKPVEMPGIPGIVAGERKNPEAPVASIFGQELNTAYSTADQLASEGEPVIINLGGEAETLETAKIEKEETTAPAKKTRGRPKKNK